MARQRVVKPEFFRDKKMAELGPQAALVYQALWLTADDGGVAVADPDLLKGEMFARWPEYTHGVLTECLQRLQDAGRVRLYSFGDDLFAEIPTLLRHQTINHPSRFRHPRGGQQVTDLRAFLLGQLTLRHSDTTTGALPEHSGSTPSPSPSPSPRPTTDAPAAHVEKRNSQGFREQALADACGITADTIPDRDGRPIRRSDALAWWGKVRRAGKYTDAEIREALLAAEWADKPWNPARVLAGSTRMEFETLLTRARKRPGEAGTPVASLLADKLRGLG